jgi:cytoskeletal protein CcmA (bactofilin family)
MGAFERWLPRLPDLKSAPCEGNIIAEELTVGGRVKGTIRANRVKLKSTAVVEGDIYHRSLAVEENAHRWNVATTGRCHRCALPHPGERLTGTIHQRQLTGQRRIRQLQSIADTSRPLISKDAATLARGLVLPEALKSI